MDLGRRKKSESRARPPAEVQGVHPQVGVVDPPPDQGDVEEQRFDEPVVRALHHAVAPRRLTARTRA